MGKTKWFQTSYPGDCATLPPLRLPRYPVAVFLCAAPTILPILSLSTFPRRRRRIALGHQRRRKRKEIIESDGRTDVGPPLVRTTSRRPLNERLEKHRPRSTPFFLLLFCCADPVSPFRSLFVLRRRQRLSIDRPSKFLPGHSVGQVSRPHTLLSSTHREERFAHKDTIWNSIV